MLCTGLYHPSVMGEDKHKDPCDKKACPRSGRKHINKWSDQISAHPFPPLIWNQSEEEMGGETSCISGLQNYYTLAYSFPMFGANSQCLFISFTVSLFLAQNRIQVWHWLPWTKVLLSVMLKWISNTEVHVYSGPTLHLKIVGPCFSNIWLLPLRQCVRTK